MPNDSSQMPSFLNYGTTRPRYKRHIVAVVLVCVVLAVSALYKRFQGNYRGLNRAASPNRMEVCVSNLKSIGQALLEYAAEHEGRFPDSLSQLLVAKNLDGWSFVCPVSHDIVATGATTQAVAQALTKPGHLSYHYAARGMRLPFDPDAVLLYEPVANHGFRINVIYGDGRNDSIPAQVAPSFITELQAGHNPPRPEMLK